MTTTTATTTTVLPILQVTQQPTVRELLPAHIPAHLPDLAILALPVIRVRVLVLPTTTGSNSSVDHPSETQLCKEMQ